jgi:two-component system, cell cycle sensor histidine kinase and response regulator CckA
MEAEPPVPDEPPRGAASTPVAAMLRDLFRDSRDAIGISCATTLLAANPPFVRLFGYDDEADMVGRSILDLMAPQARTFIAELARRRSMGDAMPPLYVTEGQRRDGSTFPLQVRSTTYVHEGEVHILVIVQDVSDQQTAERVARDGQTLYRALFDVNPAMKLLISPATGRILDANQAAVEFYGWPVDILRTMRISDINVLTAEELQEEMERARSGKRRYFEFRHRTARGEVRDVEVHSGPVPVGDDQQVLLSIIHDVTERNALQAQLRQSQRLEAIGRLAGGVAHDFNNLLTVMLNSAACLERTLPEGSAASPHLADLRHAARRATDLTRQLLAFSRRQVMRPAVVQLNEVVDGLRGFLQRSLGAPISLDMALEPDLPRVRVDPAQVEQVLMNLTLNARDAMPRGGRIAIGTGTVRITSDATSTVPAGTWVALRVTDDGEGMDEGTRTRAFEPFFTTKGVDEGTGLGLATVYGIVTQSGGHVTIDSQPGRGTEITVLLPMAEQAPAEQAPARRSTPPPASAEVLLVDDMEAVRTVLAQGLAYHGFRVEEAASAAEARERFRARRRPPDVLVSDMVMPGASGLELARELYALHPGLRVLLMSGDLRHFDLSGLPPGAHVLQKPFTATRLAEELTDLLAVASDEA